MHQHLVIYIWLFFSLGSGLISWSSTEQQTVATSFTEAEYMASCYGAKEAVWLWSLLKLIGFSQSCVTNILCYNSGSNVLTKDPSFHMCMKHIDNNTTKIEDTQTP